MQTHEEKDGCYPVWMAHASSLHLNISTGQTLVLKDPGQLPGGTVGSISYERVRPMRS